MSDAVLFTVFMTIGLSMLFVDCQLMKWRRHDIYVACIAHGTDPEACSEAAKKVE